MGSRTKSPTVVELMTYMEVDVADSQESAEVYYALNLCRCNNNRMAAAVIGGKLGTERFGAYVQRPHQLPLRKLHGIP